MKAHPFRFLLILTLFLFLASPGRPQSDGDRPAKEGSQPSQHEQGPPGDLPVPEEFQNMESLQGPENLSVQVFTDPDPLPRGGSGAIYILLNIGEGRFITRGQGETFVKPPARSGPFTLGKASWPAPSGNFRHPESGAPVPGWTGQVFLKIPVQVSPGARLGKTPVKIDFQYRVLSRKPPLAGMVNVDPIELQARVGPPLPKVVFPGKGGASPGGPSRSAAPKTKERPSGPSSGKSPGGEASSGKTGEGRLAAVPGAGPASAGEEGEEPGLPPPSGGFPAGAPLVFAAAGVLVLLALWILFRGKRA